MATLYRIDLSLKITKNDTDVPEVVETTTYTEQQFSSMTEKAALYYEFIAKLNKIKG